MEFLVAAVALLAFMETFQAIRGWLERSPSMKRLIPAELVVLVCLVGAFTLRDSWDGAFLLFLAACFFGLVMPLMLRDAIDSPKTTQVRTLWSQVKWDRITLLLWAVPWMLSVGFVVVVYVFLLGHPFRWITLFGSALLVSTTIYVSGRQRWEVAGTVGHSREDSIPR